MKRCWTRICQQKSKYKPTIKIIIIMSKNVRFMNDLLTQINKREREMQAINLTASKAIAKCLEEVEALQVVYRLNANGSVKTADSSGSLVETAGKRGPKPGPRGPRGSYKKKRKNAAPVISKKFKANLPSPDWRKEVPKALQGMNPLTAREITEKIAPGVHKKTRRVLTARCSAMLVWLKKEGVVKEVRSDDGHHVAYTV
jgi:hypothetical protein